MARAYDDLDCSLVEINPMVVLKSGQVLALDAKITFDDNAVYGTRADRAARSQARRIPRRSRPRSTTSRTSRSRQHRLHGQRRRAGDVDHGHHQDLWAARPANFLDVGGGATKERSPRRFKIITADPQVEGHLHQHLRRHHEVRHHREA